MNAIEEIRQVVAALKPGKVCRVTRAVVREISMPQEWATLFPSPPERVLSGIVGSSFELGWRGLQDGGVEFYRLDAPLDDGRRSFVESDRLQFYTRRADGLYYPRLELA